MTDLWREQVKRLNAVYTNGAEGMIKWANDNVHVPIFPLGSDVPVWTRLGNMPREILPSGRSYHYIWQQQQQVIRDCLRMSNGKFLYNLIVFCWQRGEGKSLIACLIQLWKFFNFLRQKIMLGANSKEQTKFVHYDIMRDIILNSPNLLESVGGEGNILDNEIRRKTKGGHVESFIRTISSFSGIVSNITGFTFSEMFDMKNPKFYSQLYGSIRNIPNAFGVIDSTVSAKTHVLYQLYTNYRDGKTKKIYFHYRFSREGVSEDFWNPIMDQDQLNDYKLSMPFGEYERYFQNLWEAGRSKAFSDEIIEEMGYIGVDKEYLDHSLISSLIHEKKDIMRKYEATPTFDEFYNAKIKAIDDRFIPVDRIYKLKDNFGSRMWAPAEKLSLLEDMFDTYFALSVGVDLADPMAKQGRSRTIVVIIAKGLPGSKSNPYLFMSEKPKYLYFVLGLLHIERDEINMLKEALEEWHVDYEGIDVICAERYGTWDLSQLCEDRGIVFESIFPNYDRQREAFFELYRTMANGLLKSPPIGVKGAKKDDILREELSAFDHDLEKKWFGSEEKGEKYGIQDDSVYALAWAFFGSRLIDSTMFRPRSGSHNFGFSFINRDLEGRY